MVLDCDGQMVSLEDFLEQNVRFKVCGQKQIPKKLGTERKTEINRDIRNLSPTTPYLLPKLLIVLPILGEVSRGFRWRAAGVLLAPVEPSSGWRVGLFRLDLFKSFRTS